MVDIAPHPATFRTLLVDLDALAASIARTGLDEPLVVMPADRVTAAWPEHADALAGSAWVLLWGHRRFAAARQVVDDDPQARVPVVVRDDAICDSPQAQLDLMTRNALAHRAWNPIEEARALRASVEAGRTQAETAELFGCHQSHVSGRLALLRLPEEISQAVETGRLGVAQARKLARLGGQEQMRQVWLLYRNQREDAWITSIEQAIAVYADRSAYQTRRGDSLDRAQTEGVRIIDPVEEFGRDLAVHRLTGRQQVEAARAAGTLVAAISGSGDLEHYTTRPVATPGRAPSAPTPEQRRAAAAARERAARRLAADPPVIPATASYLVDAFLRSAPDGWRPIALRWLRWLRLGPATDGGPGRWWEALYAADWQTRVWAAHCLALAGCEHRARTRHEWDRTDLAWLRRLVTEAGYAPRPWERRRLTEADEGGAEESSREPPPSV